MEEEEKQRKTDSLDVKESIIRSAETQEFDYNDLAQSASMDKLLERVRELEALVGGKEEALQVALQGLDSAMGVEVEYRAQLEGCRARVEEYQQAVQHRDQLIEQLSASLEHTLRTRDELAQDGERLVQEVSLLRSQLQATSELVSKGSSKSQHDFLLLQHRMLALEDAVKKKDYQIEEMQQQLVGYENVKKELDQKNAEFAKYKAETVTHVQQLMKEVERLHRDAVNCTSLERQRAQQLVGLEENHKREMAALRAELEEHFGQQLTEIQEKHRSQFLEHDLKKQSFGELVESSSTSLTESSDIQQQQQLEELSERALQVASEREDLLSQLELYKEQVQCLSEKLLIITSGSDSQHKMINTLENENKALKEKVTLLNDELQKEDRRVQELETLKQAQATEISSWRERVDSLTSELQKVSEVAENSMLQLQESRKLYDVEMTALQDTHAQELSFIRRQVQGEEQLKAQVSIVEASLQEKTAMEERLQGELQTSIRVEEGLKGRLIEVREELDVLRTAFDQQKEVLQKQSIDLDRLRAELQEKERSEVALQEEVQTLISQMNVMRVAGDTALIKQIDELNELLQQRQKEEEILKGQILQKEKVEEVLQQEFQKETSQYKLQLNDLNLQLQERKKTEELLRTELVEKEKSRELLQSEVKSLKSALEELKETRGEAEAYKSQVDSLNRQLQERSQTEHQMINDYESRVKSLNFDLNTIESRLSCEIQDIQARAREDLQSKQETEKRLEGELEAVRGELLVLKSSSDVQEYKEKINKLNLLVQEKQKTEAALKAELQAVSVEVAALKENQKHLENLNSDLEERLRTEQRLQEELIAAAKMHKEQVDVLSAKINELTSQHNSLDNEAHSMRQEIAAQKSYIHDLELVKEQVSQTAKTKEILINDLSECVQSLTEDNASYQKKLENLSKRLDDECHRADENVKLREVYEQDILKHKQLIEDLNSKLEEALQTRDSHLKEIAIHQLELKGYKEQLETLNSTFTEEISCLRQEYAKSFDESSRGMDVLVKELTCAKTELLSYKQQVEKLNQQIAGKEMSEAQYEIQIENFNKHVEILKKQLTEMTEAKKTLEEERKLNAEHLKESNEKLAKLEENYSKEIKMLVNRVKELESEIVSKDKHIAMLNTQIDVATCKFDEATDNTHVIGIQQQFSMQGEKEVKILWDKDDHSANVRESVSEVQNVVDDNVESVSVLCVGVQEASLTVERNSKDRDSLNFSSISETELLQLESRLQSALNEKNEVEKSFKDHINKLAENHSKDIALYVEQLEAAHVKLEDLMKIHSNCSLDKNAFRDEIHQLTDDIRTTKIEYEEKLKTVAENLEKVTKSLVNCNSEKETLKKHIIELENLQKEKEMALKSQLDEALEKYEQVSREHINCISGEEKLNDRIIKLSAQYENRITGYVEQLKTANEKSDELSTHVANSLAENGLLKDKILKMTKVCEEMSLCKEQLQIADEKLKELSKIHERCVFDKESYQKNIYEKEKSIQEMGIILRKKTDALATCEKDLEQTREYMDLLKLKLQDEISKVRVELCNLVNICSPNTGTVNKEDSKDASSKNLSFTSEKEEQTSDLFHEKGTGSLEQSFVCAATIHHEVSSLRGHVERLVSDLHSMQQKSCAFEELLVTKEENETSLKTQIGQLEAELHKNDEERKVMKEQFEELTVKFLTVQSLLDGKVEAENSIQKEVNEIAMHPCNRCKDMEEEISKLNSTILKTEGKLKDVEKERENAVSRCQTMEEKQEKLFSEKENLKKVIDDWRPKIDQSLQTNNMISRLQEKLEIAENSQNALVMEYSALKDEHKKLLLEKQTLEKVLEGLKADVGQFHEHQISDVENVSSCMGNDLQQSPSAVEKGIREELQSVKEDAAASNDQLLEHSCTSTQSGDTSLPLHNVTSLQAKAFKVLSTNAEGDFVSFLAPNRSVHLAVLKLIQQCAVLDSAKRSLSAECDTLHSRLKEQEAKELVFNEELAAAKSRCEAFEVRLHEACEQLTYLETAKGSNLALECEIQALNGENSVLKAEKVALQHELSTLQEEVWKCGESKKGSALGGADVILMKEKLNATEREGQALRLRVEALERTKQDLLLKFQVVLEESRQLRAQLETSWKERLEVEEQLGHCRCELAVAGLSVAHRSSDVATFPPEVTCSPVFHLQEEVHAMVEDMAKELMNLRQTLQHERSCHKHINLPAQEVQQTLEEVLKSNAELLEEKQALLEQLMVQKGGDGQNADNEAGCSQGDLLTQLSVYREQHVGLAEAIGAAGTLEEALRQQKEELLTTLKEKEAIQEQLSAEKVEVISSKLKIQFIEQQLQEKELLYQGLMEQKHCLEEDLKLLEMKLHEREEVLQMQRMQLQEELRTQELRLRSLQLHHRASEVERNLDESLRQPSFPCDSPSKTDTSTADVQDHLDVLREEMHKTHAEAVARLKQHLEAEFSLREQVLRAGFSAEMARTQAAYEAKLTKLQDDLLSAEKDLERLKNAELARCMGSGGYTSEELTAAQERYEQELKTICSGLDENQAHLFAVLKHLFEEFARQLIAGTTALVQTQQNKILEKEVGKLNSHHDQQLKLLQEKLERNHIRALQALKMQLTPLALESSAEHEPIHSVSRTVMTQLLYAESSQVAIVQLKHLLYSEFTNSLREAMESWALGWKAEVHSQLEALERALDEEVVALKHLRESPEMQSLALSRESAGTSKAVEELLQEADKLTSRAQELLEQKLQMAEKALHVVGERLDAAFAPVAEQAKLMITAQEISKKDPPSEGELIKDHYRQLVAQLSVEHAAEAGRLRELLAQLEAKRAQEMEELRQYFEQKVAELEKHYSEEITSQHSRRHSSSSCDSDSEFATDALLGSGDHPRNRIPPLTHICDTCAADPGYKELEERWRGELAKRVAEGQAQLSAVKKELEVRYEGELSALKTSYEEKLSQLAQELMIAQQAAVQAAELDAGRSLQAVWRREVSAARTRLWRAASHTSLTPEDNNLQETPSEKADGSEVVSPCLGNNSGMQETLANLCIELKSQLRQLEAVCRQCLQLQLDKFMKEKEEMCSDKAGEETKYQSVQLTISQAVLEERVRKEVRAELEQELEQQVEKVALLMKNNAEQEQVMFIENQKEMMHEFLEQHRHDLEALKQQHQAELSKARMGQSQTSQDNHSQQAFKDQNSAPSSKHQSIQSETSNVDCVSSQSVQTSPLRASPPFLDLSTECLRAQPYETNSVLFDILDSSLSVMESQVPSEQVTERRVVDEQNEGIESVLINVQDECTKCFKAMLLEWLEVQQNMKLGKLIGEIEVKFLTEEYVRECCSKLKAVLHSFKTLLKVKASGPQENVVEEEVCTKSSSYVQVSDSNYTSEKVGEIIQERDRWRSVGLVLKKLVEELLTYLSECEDEVNHTLLNEPEEAPLENSTAESSGKAEEIVNNADTSGSLDTTQITPKSTPRKFKRVHFAPTTFDLKNMISNEKMLLEYVQEEEDLSAKLRTELDVCLEQLRAEALSLVDAPIGDSPCVLSELQTLKEALAIARQRVTELEAERHLRSERAAEDVAEGFGEQPMQSAALGLRLHSLSQLQDKARSMLASGRPSSPQEAQQLRLLDEMCQEGDRLAEEARREREDLRQQVPSPALPSSPALPPAHPVCCLCCVQVESADKRLRDTRRFLEEQAAEREQERDEFQQELAQLQEQLKAKEKDLADQQRLSREVEALELQSKEALAKHQQLEAHRETLQVELKAAVDKVWLLRDVVAELELQAEAKDAHAAHLEARVQELQQALQEQESSRQQLTEELDTLRAEGGQELTRQVSALQEQLHAHRLQAEQCRPAALKQMKALIRELETSVEKRTQQLEALHTLSSNQSSPSEDVSVREIFQCESPEEMRAAVVSPILSLSGSVGSSPRSPPPTPLPLRELTRLQERLQRHARAEEAALKKTRDLEMQLKAARRAEEEASAERDVLQDRVSEQLLRIASLEARVDAGRWKDSAGQVDEEDEEEDEEQEEEQGLLQKRVQEAEDEAARLAGELEMAQKELQQLKENAERATAAEAAMAMQLQCMQQAEAVSQERCQALSLALSSQPAPSEVTAAKERCEKLQRQLLAMQQLQHKAVDRSHKLEKDLCAEVADSKEVRAQLSTVQQQLHEAEEKVEKLQMQQQLHEEENAQKLDELQIQLSSETARAESLETQLLAAQKRICEAEECAQKLGEELQEAQRLRDASAGIEELAGQVEKELEASAQLDSSLRDHITGVEGEKLASLYTDEGIATTKRFDNNLPEEILHCRSGSIQTVQSASVPSVFTAHGSVSDWKQQQLYQQLQQQLQKQLQQMHAATQAHALKEQELAKTLLTEKERTGELQRALRREQRRALELQSQLASQAVRAGLAVDEIRLEQASQEAALERGRVHTLEEQLKQEHAVIRQLKTALLSERQRFQAARRQDAQLLQSLQQRLNEAAAAMVAVESKPNQEPPLQPTPLVQGQEESPVLPQHLPSPSPGPAASGSHECVAVSSEAFKELQHKLTEAQNELRVLRRRLKREQEISQQFRAEVNLLRSHNNSLDSQLSELRSALAVQQAENDQLARQLRALEEVELRQQSRASTERSMAQEHARQLETNVAQLEAELAAERAMKEKALAEAACLHAATRVEIGASQGMESVATNESRLSESPPAEPIAQWLKELNVSLDRQVRDRNKVALTLARLVEERRELHQRVSGLSEQLAQLKSSEANALATITHLTNEKASVTEELISLRLDLAHSKERLYQRQCETADAQEMENRVNHLYGRYLRAESYRKALVWQKKYLLVVLGGYQQTEAYTLSQLAQLNSHTNGISGHWVGAASKGSGRGRARFRSVALVIVVIQRMKFLVRRWYLGRQIGGSTVLNKACSESLFCGLSAQGLRSSTSALSVSSWSVPASASMGTGPHSPPSHDRSFLATRPEPFSLPHLRTASVGFGGHRSSVIPSQLAQFVERCDTLQHRLGLATAPVITLQSPPSQIREN